MYKYFECYKLLTKPSDIQRIINLQNHPEDLADKNDKYFDKLPYGTVLFFDLEGVGFCTDIEEFKKAKSIYFYKVWDSFNKEWLIETFFCDTKYWDNNIDFDEVIILKSIDEFIKKLIKLGKEIEKLNKWQ